MNACVVIVVGDLCSALLYQRWRVQICNTGGSSVITVLPKGQGGSVAGEPGKTSRVQAKQFFAALCVSNRLEQKKK